MKQQSRKKKLLRDIAIFFALFLVYAMMLEYADYIHESRAERIQKILISEDSLERKIELLSEMSEKGIGLAAVAKSSLQKSLGKTEQSEDTLKTCLEDFSAYEKTVCAKMVEQFNRATQDTKERWGWKGLEELAEEFDTEELAQERATKVISKIRSAL